MGCLLEVARGFYWADCDWALVPASVQGLTSVQGGRKSAGHSQLQDWAQQLQGLYQGRPEGRGSLCTPPVPGVVGLQLWKLTPWSVT